MTLLFYGEEEPKKQALLERFTYRTEEFNPLDLIAEMEAAAVPHGSGAPLFRG